MNRREFCAAGLALPLVGCGGSEDMGQEFQLQPSPTKAYRQNPAALSGGYFTPVLAFDNQSVAPTYTVQTGFFTKNSELVTCSVWIELSSKGTAGATDVARISGFPYAASLPATNVIYANNMASAVHPIRCYLGNGSATAVLHGTSAGGFVELDYADFNGNSILRFQMVYHTLAP